MLLLLTRRVPGGQERLSESDTGQLDSAVQHRQGCLSVVTSSCRIQNPESSVQGPGPSRRSRRRSVSIFFCLQIQNPESRLREPAPRGCGLVFRAFYNSVKTPESRIQIAKNLARSQSSEPPRIQASCRIQMDWSNLHAGRDHSSEGEVSKLLGLCLGSGRERDELHEHELHVS